MAIIDFYDRGWRINPTGIAYIQGDRSYSFTEVGELSCRIANKLLSLELPRESKGAVWSANDVTAWACTLGLWRANITWIPVNPRNAAEENLYILNAFDCDVMFYQSDFSAIITELRPKLPNIKNWICIDSDGDDAPSLESWTTEQPSTRPELAYSMDDVVMLTPTGGTTGMPKGVMNTHRSLQTFVAHVLMACPYNAGERPVNLVAAPMTHAAGPLTIPCTARGGTVVVVTKPDPAPDAGCHRKAPGNRILFAPDGDLQTSGSSRNRQSRLFLGQISDLWRGTDVG